VDRQGEQVAAQLAEVRGPATTGQLLIIASGPREAQTLVMPAFSAMGHRTLWLGEASQGTRMKLVINAYVATLVEGVAEAIELAAGLGIDRLKLADAIEGSPLDAPIARAKLQKEAAGELAAEFPLVWALKDVDLGGCRENDPVGNRQSFDGSYLGGRWRRATCRTRSTSGF
jgi:3-hydroxyisobutyrate dehydrogenase